MTSRIDATKPLDNEPASKADIRANFRHARDEINHAGFLVGASFRSIEHPPDHKTETVMVLFDAAISDLQSVLGAGIRSTTSSRRLEVDISSAREIVFEGSDPARWNVGVIGNDVRVWNDGSASITFSGINLTGDTTLNPGEVCSIMERTRSDGSTHRRMLKV